MSHHDMAIDADGRSLPYSPGEIRKIVAQAIETGELMAVILEKDGAWMVQVMGPPSEKLLGCLEDTARAYRRALKGH